MQNSNIFKLAIAQYPLSVHKTLSDWREHVRSWVKKAVDHKAQVLLFPEYGSLELISIMSEEHQRNLSTQIDEMTVFLPFFLETYQKLAQEYSVYIVAPSLPVKLKSNLIVNQAYFIAPSGKMEAQEKQHMTRFEDEDWKVSNGAPVLNIYETRYGRMAIQVCYDIEFAFDSWLLAQKGVQLMLAPSCTEAMFGLNRVHIGARARALENQFYVAVSQTVGEARFAIAADKNCGMAAVYSTPDAGFKEDGIVCRGELNHTGWVYTDIDFSKLDYVRGNGSVFNFKHAGLEKVDYKKEIKIISNFE